MSTIDHWGVLCFQTRFFWRYHLNGLMKIF